MIMKLITITMLLALFASKALLKNKKVTRPYGLLTPEEEASHCRSINAPIFEFCRRMIDCHMCLETDHCGNIQNYFAMIYILK